MSNFRFLAVVLFLVSTSTFAAFSGTDLILPAVGRVEGQNATQFYTTVWVTNMNSTAVDFDIAFLLTGQANLNPARVTQTIAPGATKTYENIAESLFGIKGVLGAARIRSSANLIVSSRIYNQLATESVNASEGLFYAAVPATFGIAKGESATLQGVRQNADFRYNVFAVESGGGSATLRLRILDTTGNAVAETLVPLHAFEQQLISVGAFVNNLNDGIIQAMTLDGDGRVIVSGSQIANGSQDASGFEMAFRSDLINSGTITGVTAGAGLTGGGTSGNVTLGIAPGGVTASMLAPGAVVRSINGFTDVVSIYAGANTTITPAGNGIQISATGAPGPQGPSGLPGAPGNPGPAGLTWRGAWNSAASYGVRDAVSFSGSSYIALASSFNQQPDTNPASWSLLAAAGSVAGAAAGGDLSGTYPNPNIATVGGQTAPNVAAGAALANAATNTNTANTIVRRDASGNFAAGTITGTLNGSAAGFTGALAGDVTGTQSATVVSAVGGQTATNVAAGTIAANTATNLNAANTIVKRDASGNFAAGTITGTLNGNATGFTGALAGDVTGTQAATVVSTVGGQTAANVAAATTRVLTQPNPQQIAILHWYAAASGTTFTVGHSPWGMAFDGASIWVSNAADFTITKLRASDGAVLGTFGVGGPREIAFDGANVWITNHLANTVTKLRASDGTNLGSFAVGVGPTGIVFDGMSVWITNISDSTVTKLRASDGACVGTCTFTVGGGPIGVAFDGANIWTANQFANTVTKLRASDGAVLANFGVGTGPYGVTFDGTNIWVTNQFGNNVTKLRASDGALMGTFATGLLPTSAVFDGTNIWITNGFDATVTKLRASDGTNLGTFAVSSLPTGIAFDGASIWVANEGSNTVSKL